MALRLLAFGVRFIVPADTKGEMANLARAVGATLVTLGPGMGKALNPLYAPPRPARMNERTYIELMEQQRLLLLTALGATASGRPLTAREETGVEQALAALTRQADQVSADRMRQPSLAEFCDALLNPTPEMAAAIPVPLSVLTDDCLDLALRYRAMIKGSLKGVFDGETVEVDWNRAGRGDRHLPHPRLRRRGRAHDDLRAGAGRPDPHLHRSPVGPHSRRVLAPDPLPAHRPPDLRRAEACPRRRRHLRIRDA